MEVRMHSPRLQVVTGSGAGALAAAEKEELAKLALSRRSGAHVLCFGEGAAPSPALEVLSEGVPAIETTLFGESVRLFAPRGRGRVVELDAARREALVARARTPDGLRELERSLEESLASEARRARRSETPAAGALEPARLLPADPDLAAACSWTADEAARCVERGADGGARVAMLLRGRESFEVRPRAGGPPRDGRELLELPELPELIVRRLTSPADRGALLRVELDDEDLGPWRLGDGAPDPYAASRGEASWTMDPFFVAADLLAGRSGFRLAFTAMGDQPVASHEWGLFTRREPNGIWLTSLEPEAAASSTALARPAPAQRWSTSTGSCQLGFALGPGERAVYQLPRGYGRLVLRLEPSRSKTAGAAAGTLLVELDGRVAARARVDGGGATLLEVRLPGAASLALAFESDDRDAAVDVLDPALER